MEAEAESLRPDCFLKKKNAVYFAGGAVTPHKRGKNLGLNLMGATIVLYCQEKGIEWYHGTMANPVTIHFGEKYKEHELIKEVVYDDRVIGYALGITDHWEKECKLDNLSEDQAKRVSRLRAQFGTQKPRLLRMVYNVIKWHGAKL